MLAARGDTTESDQIAQIAALRAEVGALKRQRLETSGTSGRSQPDVARPMDDDSRAALVADIKQQLKTEMGLLPVSLLRERRQSFVELYSYDMTGASNYGTAGLSRQRLLRHGEARRRRAGRSAAVAQDRVGENHVSRPRDCREGH